MDGVRWSWIESCASSRPAPKQDAVRESRRLLWDGVHTRPAGIEVVDHVIVGGIRQGDDAAPDAGSARVYDLGCEAPANDPIWIDLAAYDALGRRLATIVRGTVAAGERTFAWNGRGTGRDLDPHRSRNERSICSRLAADRRHCSQYP